MILLKNEKRVFLYLYKQVYLSGRQFKISFAANVFDFPKEKSFSFIKQLYQALARESIAATTSRYPTEHFTILVPQKMSLDHLYVILKRRPTNFVALYLPNDRSGKTPEA